MAKSSASVNELIRRLMDGRSPAAAARGLVAAGGQSVEPVLEALAGYHGRLHPDIGEDTTNQLMQVLAKIAKDDPTPLAAAMAHDVPAVNAAVWALGHSQTRHAQQILDNVMDQDDEALRAIATYHRSRRRPANGKSAGRKSAGRKSAAKGKAAAKRKKGAKKKARAKR